MANKYDIPEEVEQRIRHRDKDCVYCHKTMVYPCIGNERRGWATIEHLNNAGPFDEESNLAICCFSCNSSRRNKELLTWFKTSYCFIKNDINEVTVADPIKEYIRFIEKFINRFTWTFAQTMPQIPHSYVKRDSLSDNDKETFDDLSGYITRIGYSAEFESKKYDYLNTGGFKYWIIGDVLNKAEIKTN